jgi:hypothetical protein
LGVPSNEGIQVWFLIWPQSFKFDDQISKRCPAYLSALQEAPFKDKLTTHSSRVDVDLILPLVF